MLELDQLLNKKILQHLHYIARLIQNAHANCRMYMNECNKKENKLYCVCPVSFIEQFENLKRLFSYGEIKIK